MIKFIDSISPAGKDILLRVDFNVPVDAQGKVKDDFRIQRSLPTIKYLLLQGARKTILLSHLGRPKEEDQENPQYSLQLIAQHLEVLLREKVYFFREEITNALKEKITALPPKAIVLLENLRFFPEEGNNDFSFAEKLASLGDIFVDDAFAVSQRRVASLCAITNFLPSFGGLLLKDELTALNTFSKTSPPFVIILGGAKIKEKIPLIAKFYSSADSILLGGAIANTVLQSWGEKIGLSLRDETVVEEAKTLKERKEKIILPLDFLVLNEGRKEKRLLGKIKENDIIFDIGPEASKSFQEIIALAKSILWNGPLGKYEDKRFKEGTESVIEAILRNKTAKTVIGGGDTLSSFRALKPAFKIQNTKYRFFSTGGGAMLEYLAGETLPGLQALNANTKY